MELCSGSTNSTGGDSLPVNYVITAAVTTNHSLALEPTNHHVLLPPESVANQGGGGGQLEKLDCGGTLVQMQTTPYATL